jgi:NADH:ubiquinone oxidoreductase subunit 2 (subunit N)
MNSIFIWIILPIVISMPLYVFRKHTFYTHTSGLITAIILAWLAWQLPIGETITLELGVANPSFYIADSMSALGRELTISNSSRPALTLLYFALSVWLGGAYFIKSGQTFISFALAVTAILAASLTFGPDLYAIIIVELAVLFSIPIISPPGRTVGSGVIRFLAFQTLGMCLILFSYWSLSQIDSSTPILPNLIILALGFAMVLAIFPFHTWISGLAMETNPFTSGLIFFLIPTAVTLILVSYTNRLVILGISQEMFLILRITGSIMLVTGGLWSFFENHLGRIMGFAVISQIGMTLLAISLFESEARISELNGLYFAQITSTAIGIVIWGFALAVIHNLQSGLSFKETRGIIYSAPFAGTAVIITNFSMAGLPLLGSFPIFFAILSATSRNYQLVTLLALFGSALLFAAGVRVLYNATNSSDTKITWQSSEPVIASILLAIGICFLFTLGAFHQFFLPQLIDMGITFISFGQ